MSRLANISGKQAAEAFEKACFVVGPGESDSTATRYVTKIVSARSAYRDAFAVWLRAESGDPRTGNSVS
ncbi:MAG: hypothetical protein ABIH23_07890 [bacterium]